MPASEDCLFIDVFAPSRLNGSAPVMIWLQGGAFVNLFNPNYNGSALVEAASDNAVIVSFNYRVGPQGFLASDELRDEGNLNLGLHDQRMAIRWVERNIHKFGGDPDNVTLFGTSIGAGSILLHTLAHDGQPSEAEELNWHAGIATSVAITSVYEVEDLQDQYQDFLQAAGCESLQCLRGLSSAEFQAANTARPQLEMASAVGLFPYGAVKDGVLLGSTPSAALAAGNFSTKRPLIIGSSHSEGTIFAPQANSTQDVNTYLKAQYPLLTDADLATAHELYLDVPETYPGVETPQAPLFYRAAAMIGDAMFSCPALSLYIAQRDAGARIHVLRNAVVDPVEQSAGFLTPHTWEVEGVWGPGQATQYVALPGAESYRRGGENHELVRVFQSLWLEFAQSSGNLNEPSCLPRWTDFDGDMRLRVKAGDVGMERVEGWELKRCEFWNSVAERTRV